MLVVPPKKSFYNRTHITSKHQFRGQTSEYTSATKRSEALANMSPVEEEEKSKKKTFVEYNLVFGGVFVSEN